MLNDGGTVSAISGNVNTNFNHRPTGFGLMVVSSGRQTRQSGSFTERSERPDYQLIHTIEGEAPLVTDEGSLVMTAGSWTLIDCMKYHYYHNQVTWTYEYLHICGSDMTNYLTCLPPLPFTVAAVDEQMMQSLLRQITERDFSNTPKEYALDNAIIAMLLALLVKAMDCKVTPDVKQDPIETVLDYIHTNYAKELTIDELTRVAHLSKYYFCHLFKQRTGMSPYQYINRHRLMCAEELLSKNYLSIQDIAFRCGFVSTGAFIRAFKASTGNTPGKIRKQDKKNQ